MVEILIAIGSGLFGVIIMIIRDTFYKGKNQQKIDSMVQRIQNLDDNFEEYKELMNENISLLKQSNEARAQTISNMVRDHVKIEQSIDELNKNIGINNQAIASLDATLQGVNNLLKHIISGQLKIAES